MPKTRQPGLSMGYIETENRPGLMAGRLVMTDPRIIIDRYHPEHPELQWYCDHCETGHPVTAQFKPAGEFITLCRVCLQNAINGIDLSLADGIARPPEPTERRAAGTEGT